MTSYTEGELRAMVQVMRQSSDRGKPFAVLFGAGGSAAGGVPVAAELTRRIRDTYKDILERRLPPQRSDYQSCMGCLTYSERRELLQPILERAAVTDAHRALAALVAEGLVGRILTMNFDMLLERACAEAGHMPFVYDFAAGVLRNTDHLASPSVLHLHGQGAGLAAFNTEREADEHADEVEPALIDTMDRYPLLVIGYSGRQDNIYPRLLKNYRGRQRLYWVAHNRPDPETHVAALINRAPTAATYMSAENASAFLVGVARVAGCWTEKTLAVAAAPVIVAPPPAEVVPEPPPEKIQDETAEPDILVQDTSPPDVEEVAAESAAETTTPEAEPPLAVPAEAVRETAPAPAPEPEPEPEPEPAEKPVVQEPVVQPEKRPAAEATPAEEPEAREEEASPPPFSPPPFQAPRTEARPKVIFERVPRPAPSAPPAAEPIQATPESERPREEPPRPFSSPVPRPRPFADQDAFARLSGQLRKQIGPVTDAPEMERPAAEPLARSIASMPPPRPVFQSPAPPAESEKPSPPPEITIPAPRRAEPPAPPAARAEPPPPAAAAAPQRQQPPVLGVAERERLHLRAGVSLVKRAIAERQDHLFMEAFSEFDTALNINPRSYQTLMAWGDALFALASRKRDEAPYREAFAKYEAAIRMQPETVSAHLSWANALAHLAGRKRDQAIYQESLGHYERAASVKPEDAAVLANWGAALTGLAGIKADRALYVEACAKFATAFKIDANNLFLLNGWSAALMGLWHLQHDKSLLDATERVLVRAEKLSGKPQYNLACVAALKGEEERCRRLLLECQSAGTLPPPDRLRADRDLAAYHDTPWFKELVG